LYYQGGKYRATKVPCSLIKAQKPFFEVNEMKRIDHKIRVTSLERTFVDILNRPFLMAYDWEEIARSLDKVYIGRPSVVVEYLKLLESPITASRVGYFIERDKLRYNINSEILDEIHKLSLKSLTYLDPNRKQENVLVEKWNLMVPKSLEYSTWEEPIFHE
jgi:predicted transcriptional regulator of viral defense system